VPNSLIVPSSASSTGGGSAWVDEGNATGAPNGSVATSTVLPGDSTRFLRLTVPAGTRVPPGATISSVSLRATAAITDDLGGKFTVYARLVVAGVVTGSDVLLATGFEATILTLLSGAGAVLTAAQLNGEVGLDVWATNTGDAAETLRVDAADLEVTYTPPPIAKVEVLDTLASGPRIRLLDANGQVTEGTVRAALMGVV
jgi:hypothetical protein